MAKIKSLRVASDKSITHRAIMLSSISRGEVDIINPLYSDDTLRTLKAMQSAGVSVDARAVGLKIKGKGRNRLKEPLDVLDLGNSGTSMRLLSGLFGGEGVFVVLTGDSSLRKRPMMRIIEPLSRMGVNFLYREGGFAPLAIKGGGIRGIKYAGKIASAQVKSAILLAGLYTEDEVSVQEPFKSRNHTENMLRAFGVDVIEEENSVKLGKSRELIGDFEINIPADISSAAFFMVFSAIKRGARLKLKDVLLNPTRSGILDIFDNVGVRYSVENYRVEGFEAIGDVVVEYSPELRPFDIDGSILPRLIDEIPILSVLAVFCDGKSIVREAIDLRKKESDRIKAICDNLKRVGVSVLELEDGFEIHGNPHFKPKPATINTFGDHRIAMSFLVLQALTGADFKFTETHSILTSYPNFFDHLDYVVS